MKSVVDAYPLAWPEGWKRTPAHQRRNGRFKKSERTYSSSGYAWNRQRDITVAEGVKRVVTELERFGVHNGDAIISSNLEVRLDGLPRSGQKKPDDPGVAVYWQRPQEPMRCMAIDLYNAVEDNLAAIAATLDAMRAIERHGGAAILDRAFTGFAALPPPEGKRDWQAVLGLQELLLPTLMDARNAYRRLAADHHPDRGGDAAKMAEINRAWEDAQKELA